MLATVKQLIGRLTESKSHELSQSLVRTGLVIVVCTYLFVYYTMFPEKEVVMPFIWAVMIYFCYCILLIAHILLFTRFIPLRHYFTIVFDMSLLGIGMYSGGVAAAFFYGGYFWLIMGNGLRFGQRSLLMSVVLAALSFTVVIGYTAFWQENLVLGLGLLIWLFLLPPYIGKLITSKDSAIAQAQMADNAKSRFLANMSHELRTPLNGIIGYSQMIHEEDVDIEEAKYGAEKIDKAANHLLALISELLDLAGIESGKLKVKPEAVEIVALINEVITLVETSASKRNINIKLDTIVEQTVLADRLRLKQVLVNLLSNAIKYNYENGVVTISVLKDKNKIEIRICDNGPGLNKEEQKKVFEPFERLTANSSNVEGAGIGLMISRSLVHMMEGEIGVESAKNKGSCFWVKLPVVA
jgi:two-component system sensor histidine kinase RpfC